MSANIYTHNWKVLTVDSYSFKERSFFPSLCHLVKYDPKLGPAHISF